MPGKAGTLEILAQQIGLALQPLQMRLAPENVIAFLSELGLQFPPQLLQPSFVSSVTASSTAAASLTNTLNQLATHIKDDNVAGIVQDGSQLVQQIRSVIASFPEIGTALKGLAGALPGMNADEVTTFAENLPANLLSHSVISHLEDLQPGLVGVANLFGILSYRPDFGNPDNATHPAFIDRKLQLSNLTTALTSPLALLKSQYQWGGPGFDGTLLIPRLSASFKLFDLNSEVVAPGPPTALDSGLLSIGTSTSPPGLFGTLHYDLPSGLDITLPLSSRWSVRLQTQGDFKAGLQALIVPPFTITLRPATGTLTGSLQMNLIATGPDSAHPLIILGEAGASRLQADSVTLGVGMPATWDAGSKSAKADLVAQLEVAKGKAIIDTSNSDGFIGKILGGSSLESNLDLGITYSINDGLRFRGGSALEIKLAQHVMLGPVAVNNLILALGIKDGTFPVTVTADFQVSLGPLTAVVTGIGFRITIKVTEDNKGNLGPIDIQPGFQPPNGVGLELNAGGFAGAGFLFLNPEKGEYAGGLELTFLGFDLSPRGGHSLHAVARRQQGILAADHPGQRVPSDSALVWLHAARYRRTAGPQPNRAGRCTASGRP